nr:hypothetical protein [Tanacetum cinerariifolium]
MPYVLEPVYPEYIPVKDEVFPAEEQPLPVAASPTTDSPGYIPESDPDEDPEDDDDDEDPEEDPADYPADHDDDEEEEEPSGDDADEDLEDDDDEDLKEDPADYPAAHDDEEEEEPSGDDADEEDEEQDEDDDDEEEEHKYHLPHSQHHPLSPHTTTYCITTLIAGESSAAAVARPIEGRRADYGFVGSAEAEIRRWIAEDIRYGIRDTWIDERDVAEEEALTTLEGVNTRGRQTEIFQRVEALVDDRQADRPDVTLPPRKRLSIVHCSGYEAGESSAAAAARPIEEYIEYGIRDTWIDPRDVAEEEALTTLEGVNTRVTELAAVQEQDTQDIYGVMEDAQGRHMEIFQRVEALGHLVTALGETQALQAREQARVGAPEGAGSST